MIDLHADKYLIEALGYANFTKHTLSTLKLRPDSYRGEIAHARALERNAELEAGDEYMQEQLGILRDAIIRTETERDEALARNAKLEADLKSCRSELEKADAECVDLAARLAKYEPPVDPDLVVARGGGL